MKSSELVAPLIRELETAADALEKLGPKWWSVKSFKYRIRFGATCYSLTCHAFRPEEIRERARQIAKSAKRRSAPGYLRQGWNFLEPDLSPQISTKRPPKPLATVAEQFLTDQEPDNYKAYLELWK